MAPAAVYLVLSVSLTLGVATGVVLRIVWHRARLRRRFGPLYGEVVERHGRRRGRSMLRAASDRFDRELELLTTASLPSPPQRPEPGGDPTASDPTASDPTAEQQVRPSPES